MEIHPIEPQLEPWQLAVKLHVLMCGPTASDRRHQNLCDAIGAKIVEVTLKQAKRDFPKELTAVRADLRAAFPDYDWEARRQIKKRFIELHERALRAGMFVLALISKAATDKYPAFVDRLRQPSHQKVARYIREQEGGPLGVGEGIGERGTDPEEVVHQFLRTEIRPWFPVAHVAAAFQLVAREYDARAAEMTFDYQDGPFFAEILRRADEVAQHIRATPGAGGIARKLIPLDAFGDLRRFSPLDG